MATIQTKYDIGQEVFIILHPYHGKWFCLKEKVTEVRSYGVTTSDDQVVIEFEYVFPTLELAQAECNRRNNK